MVPEFWLIDEPTQDAIAGVIDAAADSVIDNFDNFGNENSITAALGHELLQTRLEIGGTSASFVYRNFLEQREEPVTGADGGIVVTIKTRDQTIKKAVLFQAKRFPQDRGVKDLSLPRTEARRLKLQVNQMIPITSDCIVLAQTRERMYAIDGRCADRLSIDNLRYVTEACRLVSLGTFLGKWVARCTKGDQGDYVVRSVERPLGFVHHQLEMNVVTNQPPMLARGEAGSSGPALFDSPTPIRRRRH
jgi:hypothetical protein